MRGVVTRNIVGKVEQLIRNNPTLRTIVMTNAPGSDDDQSNLKAARLVHEAKLGTCVPDDGEIASGAVDFFLAGVTRSVGENTFVGVHSWASGKGVQGADLPRNDKRHNLFLNYYRDISFDTEFYYFTIGAAPAEGIHDMTPEERIFWGIETN